ncbi:MAG: hypothetical protein QXN05_04935 [Acidilobaceae archaeon]
MSEEQSLMDKQYISHFVIVLATALTGLVLGIAVSLSYRAEGASLLLFSILTLYVGTTVTAPRLLAVRVLIALFMMAVHIGAVLTYYSNPLVLPLLVIERGVHGNSVNFDFIQLVLAYEVVSAYLASKSRSDVQNEVVKQDESLKENQTQFV